MPCLIAPNLVSSLDLNIACNAFAWNAHSSQLGLQIGLVGCVAEIRNYRPVAGGLLKEPFVAFQTLRTTGICLTAFTGTIAVRSTGIQATGNAHHNGRLALMAGVQTICPQSSGENDETINTLSDYSQTEGK
jgi:hypothetical protein